MMPAIELVQTIAAGAPLSTSVDMNERSVFLRAAAGRSEHCQNIRQCTTAQQGQQRVVAGGGSHDAEHVNAEGELPVPRGGVQDGRASAHPSVSVQKGHGGSAEGRRAVHRRSKGITAGRVRDVATEALHRQPGSGGRLQLGHGHVQGGLLDVADGDVPAPKERGSGSVDAGPRWQHGPLSKTHRPRSRAAWATARPMPEAPPVITAIPPFRVSSGLAFAGTGMSICGSRLTACVIPARESARPMPA